MQRSWITVLVVTFLLSAQLAIPQAISPPAGIEFDQSTGLPNGRMWSKMSDDARQGWLLGFKNAIFVAEAVTSSKGGSNPLEKALDRLYSSKLTLGEEVKGIDHFYVDTPENMPIPIINALQYVVAKANGATQADLDILASGLRKSSQR